MEKTKPLFCRVPESTHILIHQHAGGQKAIGAFVSQCVRAYLAQPNDLAKALLKAIREEQQ
jgi:hypothetical protein